MKMKLLPTLVYLNECLEYNQVTGKLFWKIRPLEHFLNLVTMKRWNKTFSKKEAFTSKNNTGYKQGEINNEGHMAHRIIYKMMTGQDPITYIDHKDGNKENNCWTNLRLCCQSENNINSKLNKRNSSGYRGVFKHDKKYYRAVIHVDYKKIHLGLFITKEEAALAYNKAALFYYKEFSKLNVIKQ